MITYATTRYYVAQYKVSSVPAKYHPLYEQPGAGAEMYALSPLQQGNRTYTGRPPAL